MRLLSQTLTGVVKQIYFNHQEEIMYQEKVITQQRCDRSKATDRQVMHFVAATAHALGHDVSNIALSRSLIQRV